jgi:hypothetical protein
MRRMSKRFGGDELRISRANDQRPMTIKQSCDPRKMQEPTTDDRRLKKQTKRPPRQKGGLFFQGRIVLTEGKVRQNFLAKSYGPKKGGVKEILDNKCLCFQSLTKACNNPVKRIKMRFRNPVAPVNSLN